MTDWIKKAKLEIKKYSVYMNRKKRGSEKRKKKRKRNLDEKKEK